MRMNDYELCDKGLGVLSQALGVVDAERFIMLMNQGAEDYTEWRRTHLYQDETLDSLAEKARSVGEKTRRLMADCAL